MSTDDQSTPTPMAVERRHVLMPAAALADLLGAGFYLPRTAEILDSYGGWTTGAKQEADSLPARIHDDYLRNCQNSRRAEIHERVLSDCPVGRDRLAGFPPTRRLAFSAPGAAQIRRRVNFHKSL